MVAVGAGTIPGRLTATRVLGSTYLSSFLAAEPFGSAATVIPLEIRSAAADRNETAAVIRVQLPHNAVEAMKLQPVGTGRLQARTRDQLDRLVGELFKVDPQVVLTAKRKHFHRHYTATAAEAVTFDLGTVRDDEFRATFDDRRDVRRRRHLLARRSKRDPRDHLLQPNLPALAREGRELVREVHDHPPHLVLGRVLPRFGHAVCVPLLPALMRAGMNRDCGGGGEVGVVDHV